MKQIFIKSTNNSAGLCRLLIPGGIFKDAAFFAVAVKIEAALFSNLLCFSFIMRTFNRLLKSNFKNSLSV
jgi:hypothetical protein